MKRIITWLYTKIVNEPYIPEYSQFSIGVKSDVIPEAKYWMSYLPEILSVHFKTKKGDRTLIFER